MNTEQEKAVVELVRKRGEVCPSPHCRSAEFLAVADPVPKPLRGGDADVLMMCSRYPHPHPVPGPWYIGLSRAELRSFGIGS